jgi:predicted phosphodiesterase
MMEKIKIIMISDLHLKRGDTVASLKIDKFCEYIKKRVKGRLLIFVLGDIINRGKRENYMVADEIFTYIKSRLSSATLLFIPGNQDICDDSFESFNTFCLRHNSEVWEYNNSKVWAFETEDLNFIFANSNDGTGYKSPGKLDFDGIEANIKSQKHNILLLHHSLYFEDVGSHTGILEQARLYDLLKTGKIDYVFHGHVHSPWDSEFANAKVFGVDSLEREFRPFLSVDISAQYVQSIHELIYLNGRGYIANQKYPKLTEAYADPFTIPPKEYREYPDYIARKVIPYSQAEDQFLKYWHYDEWPSLTAACMQNKRIILISDAGMGKSAELEQLAHNIYRDFKEYYAVLLPLRLFGKTQRLREFIYENVPEYKTLNPNSLFLILDGYDELSDAAHFRQELEKYLKEYPQTHIVVSMRSNFLLKSEAAFSGFEKYLLMEISNGDIERILDNRFLNREDFYRECQLKGLRQLIGNPFYLQHIVDLYEKCCTLPLAKDLMEQIIDICIEKDSEKAEYSFSPIGELQYEMKTALTRFAYYLQLSGLSKCDDNDYGKYIERSDRDLIKCSSLTVKTNNEKSYSHAFSHNNFKEFLVALYLSNLSLEEILNRITVTDVDVLDERWYNVLAFLVQIFEGNELIKWISEHEPLALAKADPTRVPSETRYRVLEGVLRKIIDENVWYDDSLCSYARLARFCESGAAIDLLLDQIDTPCHFRAVNFCLYVLSNIKDLFGKDTAIRDSLVACYKNPDVRDNEKRIAIKAIAELRLSDRDISDDLVTRFWESDSSYIRAGIYAYLHVANMVDAHIGFLLQGLERYDRQDLKDDVLSEQRNLETCLKNISNIEAVAKTIDFFTLKNKNCFHIDSLDNVLNKIFNTAMKLYKSGHTTLLKNVYQCFLVSTSHWVDKLTPIAMRFFRDTDTLELVLKWVLNEKSEPIRICAVETILDEDEGLRKVFKGLYETDKFLNPEDFLTYTRRIHNNDPDLFNDFDSTIYKKTGKHVDIPEQIDYETVRKQGIQRYFDSLFDKTKATEILRELLLLIDKPDITFTELKDAKNTLDWEKRRNNHAARELYLSLRRCAFDDNKVSAFFSIVDWDFFVLKEVTRLIIRDRYHVTINSDQKEEIERLYHQLESYIDFENVYSEDGNHIYSDSNFHLYLRLNNYFSFSAPREYFLGLLKVSSLFIIDEAHAEKKYKMLEEHLTQAEITNRVAELINEPLPPSVIDELLFWCRTHQLDCAIGAAVRFCLDSSVESYHKDSALEYLKELRERDCILEKVMPESDEDVFLMIANMFVKDESDSLRVELEKRFAQSK